MLIFLFHIYGILSSSSLFLGNSSAGNALLYCKMNQRCAALVKIRISFLSQCGSGYGYRKPNQCGSRGIQIWILVRLLSHKKFFVCLNSYMKNILKVGNKSKNIPTKVQKTFLKGKKPGLFVLVDFYVPGFGSGSKTAR
jgi:hypothetical protein